MKNRTAVLLLVLLIVPCSVTFGQVEAEPDSTTVIRMPPIVVTAERVPTAAAEVASAITVITGEEIERRQYRTVLEALRSVPGVSVVQTGGPGGATSAFLRGAAPEQTLVLIDGVEMNDPGSPGGAYDLANLLAMDVERIEVLRGPQSTLYGSSAMGGVIHVVTRRASSGSGVDLATEGGGLGTLHGGVGLTGAAGNLLYAGNLSRRTTDGVSATDMIRGRGEKDGHEVTAWSVRLDWEPSVALSLRATAKGSRAETDLDQSSEPRDDPNFISKADELALRGEARLVTWEERWSQILAVSFARHDRETRDELDEGHPNDRSRGTFEGDQWKIEWVSDLHLAPGQRLTFGAETESASAASKFRSESAFGPFQSEFPEESAGTAGVFVSHRSEFGNAHVSIGGRIDHHSRFGTEFTYRVAPSVRFATATRLKATYGTGFKSPTLFQMFDPEFGNRGLSPETSWGWDVGIEQFLFGDRLGITVTWFDSEFEDVVGFRFPDGYLNLQAARVDGLEVTVDVTPRRNLRLDATYTYTDAEEKDEEGEFRPLIRRPRHEASLSVDVDWTDRVVTSLAIRRIGEREDLDFGTFPAKRVTLDPYTILRASGSLSVTESLRVFGRVENLLDEEYQEALGFGTPGRVVFVGLRATL
jgi:vitamin B12 transporter